MFVLPENHGGIIVGLPFVFMFNLRFNVPLTACIAVF